MAQYPAIAPPAITINAAYPGASARTLEDTVTQVIEQRMKGLDHLMYVASTSDSSGSVAMTLTFDPAADPDIARLLVGLGVRELSSTAAAVPAVKAALRETSLEELRDLAAGALAARDANAVRELLR